VVLAFNYVPEGKMNSSCEGIWSKAVIFSWKFFAITSFGTWASQSITCRIWSLIVNTCMTRWERLNVERVSITAITKVAVREHLMAAEA